MKFAITPFVAPEIFSDNFPGRNLSQDISGLTNLLTLQLEKRFDAGFDSLQEMKDYVSQKLDNTCIKEFGWIFNSPGWEFFISSNRHENKIEFLFDAESNTAPEPILSIIIEWQGEFAGDKKPENFHHVFNNLLSKVTDKTQNNDIGFYIKTCAGPFVDNLQNGRSLTIKERFEWINRKMTEIRRGVDGNFTLAERFPADYAAILGVMGFYQ